MVVIMNRDGKPRWVIKEVRDNKGNVIKEHPFRIASTDISRPFVIYSNFEGDASKPTREFVRYHNNNITIELKVWRKPKREEPK